MCHRMSDWFAQWMGFNVAVAVCAAAPPGIARADSFEEDFESGTFASWDFSYSTSGAQSGAYSNGAASWSSSIVAAPDAINGTYSARLYVDSPVHGDLSGPWGAAAAIHTTVSGVDTLEAAVEIDQIQGSGGGGGSWFQIAVFNAADTSKSVSYGFNSTGDAPGDFKTTVSSGSSIAFSADVEQDYFDKHGEALPGPAIVRFMTHADYAEGGSGHRTTEVRLDDIRATFACPTPSTPQPDPGGIENNRFLSFVPGNAGAQTAIRVELVDLSLFPAFNGTGRWVGEPVQAVECDGTTPYWTARLQCTPYFRDWGPIDLLNVYSPEIAPEAEYEIRTVDQFAAGDLGNPNLYSCPLTIHTQIWCDVTDDYGGAGQPNFIDIGTVVNCFKCLTTAPPKRRCKVFGSVLDPDLNINFQDINDCVSSFKSLPYGHAGPDTSSDTTWYIDSDGDGYGDASTTMDACGQPFGYSDDSDDCDDADSAVHPGATEICNGYDDDCDTVADPPDTIGCTVFYRDNDDDGYGQTGDSMCLCSPSGSYTAVQGGDCQDGDGTVNPGETEACNGKDDDCDTVTDPPDSDGCTTFYRDNDNDAFGQTDDSQCLCSASSPYDTPQAGDCNDGNPSINPGAFDQPDDSFVDSNCDGIDGDEIRAIFVSPIGNDANPGTRALPKRRITSALSAAQATARNVYAAGGPYIEGSTVKLLPGVSIYSGYDTTFAVRNNNAANRAQITVSHPEAVQAQNLGGTQVVLDRVLIDGGNATAPGDSGYGVRALNSSLWIRFSEVRARHGVDGTNGSGGSPGASGSNGQRGQPGCEDSTFLCKTCSRPQGGSPGGSACGRTGGAGGSAGHGSSSGSAGSTGTGGTLGGSGAPAGQGNWVTPSNFWGDNGTDGAPGMNGAPGFNGNSRYTSVGFNPLDAGSGATGGHGAGGGGGGGGGGGTTDCDSYGGGGGGGGGGGCGGGSGQGGRSGGGSFAIYAWASNIVVENSLLRAERGGNGGSGGSGASGGSGGFGGNCTGGSSSDPRGNCYGGSTEQDDGSNGGRGGNGGQGGDGGHGGGGAGGPCIGIVRGGATNLSVPGVSYSLGPPGGGGPSAGNSGPNGIVTSVFTP